MKRGQVVKAVAEAADALEADIRQLGLAVRRVHPRTSGGSAYLFVCGAEGEEKKIRISNHPSPMTRKYYSRRPDLELMTTDHAGVRRHIMREMSDLAAVSREAQ